MTDATPPQEPPPGTPPSPNNRLPWILGAVALVVAVVIVIVVVASGDDESGTVATGGDNGSQEDGGSSDNGGATPEQIATGQAALRAVGCYSGAVDGVYGPASDQAVRDFQAASGLEVDGVFGPATLAALESAVASGEVVCVPDQGGAESVLQDAESPDGGTVKQLVVPGPETSVLVACDQTGFQPFFFTDQGSWVGCEVMAGVEAGPPSELTEAVMDDVDGPAGGTVKQVTIPGPETSVLLACAAEGSEPFLFTDQGIWVGCQGG